MNKYLKGIAVAAMITAVAVMTPAVGLAAGNATIKANCMSAANTVATAMAQTGPANTKAVLTLFGAGLKAQGGEVTVTDTELLWVMPINVNPAPTMEIKIYPATRKVYVSSKGPGIYESATASY